MIIVKIDNIQGFGGNIDYKGLDLNGFVAGTPLYSKDLSTFCGYTTQELEDTSLPQDVSIINQEEYEAFKEANKVEPIELFDAQKENAKLKEELANLWEIVLFGGETL